MTATVCLEAPAFYPAEHAAPPEPLALPWPLRPLGSAEYGVESLDDGRTRYWIRHAILRGVTPSMLVFWFSHLEGTIDVAGREISRYRAWHPYDHVHASYARRMPDGGIGPGAAIRLREYLGANRAYEVDIVTDIERLDEGGFVHNPRVRGVSGFVRMEYQFSAVPGGTKYENCLIVGAADGGKRTLNRWITRRFGRAHGLAWIRHNVEEVGMFENILPPLYAAEAT